ncbi:phosphomevalonate kinase [Fistulifera solaris]|uniref:phosphomevalonate kinase n=1 Tax=Fistulifera solaris TaxID=1519565 RepID=A0A1Z5K3Z9_FISSO|nr:phosphomevalonate kinase [Fistulifera solaris]|eukprot:GAX20939.1 phosphomevalonate kinase [Fistulifera solaris]
MRNTRLEFSLNKGGGKEWMPNAKSSIGGTLCASTMMMAPGKILLAGGYLVLEPMNFGLVIAVDKRVFTTAMISRAEHSDNTVQIQVDSPQFGQSWKYSYNRKEGTFAESMNASSNELIEKTLRVSLLYLLENDPSVHSIHLKIQADNDFYSLATHLKERNLPITLNNALSLPKFLPATVDQTSRKVCKSGLGSSACLVTSMVGALCHKFQKSDAILYNLAQISHCYAQGKVGSGFDVSAACHGSHVYQRFPETILHELLSTLETPSSIVHAKSLLKDVVESTWPGGVIKPLTMRGFLQVIMADVSGGSESPSMARSVLAWKRKQQKGRISHWDELAEANQEIVRVWQQLMDLPSLTKEEVTQLASCSPEKWSDGLNGWTAVQKETGRLTAELRRLLLDTRRHLKQMGEGAGVPVEPDEQTTLADATSAVPGVVAALVPGAGGYDALACLYINQDE